MSIPEYCGIYGAVLATYGAILATLNRLRDRSRVKVDLLPAVEGNVSGVCIIVRNLSSHSVHLAAVGLLYPSRRLSTWARLAFTLRFRRLPGLLNWVDCSLAQIHGVETRCPVKLEPRDAHRVFIAESVVEAILTRASERILMAHVQDQIWRDEYSRALRYGDALVP